MLRGRDLARPPEARQPRRGCCRDPRCAHRARCHRRSCDGARHAQPLWWSFPDEEPNDEQAALDAEKRHLFVEGVTRRGLSEPSTVAELADVLAELGVFVPEHGPDGERWRDPEVLPLATEALSLTGDAARQEDELRWEMATEPATQAVITLLADSLDRPEQVSTSIAALSRATDLDPDAARAAIARLVDDGDLSLATTDGTPVQPERLDAETPISLAANWVHFDQHRIRVRRSDRD